MVKRCAWAISDLAIAYHDREWGVPQHDDRVLFEFLILEGAQAGLSWETILRKRDAYRDAFADFDPERVAGFTAHDATRLMNDAGIVRNRLKIESAIGNARAFLTLRDACGSFDAFLWNYVDGRPIRTRRRRPSDVPSSTPLSDALSKDLKKRGFTFVGTTICYSFLQAVGVVDDHLVGCVRSADRS